MTTGSSRARLRPAVRWVRRRRGAVEMAVLAVVAHVPIHRLRIIALRAFGATIDPLAVVYHGFQVRAARNLVIGARAQVGDHAILDARGGLRIGDDVNVSTGVQVWTAQHAWDRPGFDFQLAPVEIGDKAWLGPRVVVLPGTVVGEGTVVAAGAVARGELAPYALYGGVPARKLADRPRGLDYELPGPSDKTWWW